MMDSMENTFSKLCEVFGIEKLNKQQEDSNKYVVRIVLSICRQGLASY